MKITKIFFSLSLICSAILQAETDKFIENAIKNYDVRALTILLAKKKTYDKAEKEVYKKIANDVFEKHVQLMKADIPIEKDQLNVLIGVYGLLGALGGLVGIIAAFDSKSDLLLGFSIPTIIFCGYFGFKNLIKASTKSASFGRFKNTIVIKAMVDSLPEN
ncbi:hypothetical protein M1446_04925 [Candidatus Dependentiae bacterium]|nr:hypothetical protein [Candidatus Dependentiae bacterium]